MLDKPLHSKPARYGLIGYPLDHSFSPAWFGEKFRHEGILARYDAFPIDSVEELPALVASQCLEGFNITIPYKEAVVPELDHLSLHAQAIEAVNCVQVAPDGTWIGHNTDWVGFAQSLTRWMAPLPAGALILGTGGAARAVAYALQQLGVAFKRVSRRATVDNLTYADITAQTLLQYPLLVNTTPLGTFPGILGKPPLPYELLLPSNLLYDLVYNPAETAFMQEGVRRGCRVKNGLEMLQIQAAESWAIWQAAVNP